MENHHAHNLQVFKQEIEKAEEKIADFKEIVSSAKEVACDIPIFDLKLKVLMVLCNIYFCVYYRSKAPITSIDQ